MLEDLSNYVERLQANRASFQQILDKQAKSRSISASSKSSRSMARKSPTGGGGKIGGAKKNGKIGLGELVDRIAQQESGGNYRALGDYNSGDRAYGKYQIMGNNIPSWTQEYLGKSLTPQQFLSREHAQDKVAKGKLKYYYKRYGAGGAAASWYGGESAAKGWKNYRSSEHSDNGNAYPSIYEYVKDILRGG